MLEDLKRMLGEMDLEDVASVVEKAVILVQYLRGYNSEFLTTEEKMLMEAVEQMEETFGQN